MWVTWEMFLSVEVINLISYEDDFILRLSIEEKVERKTPNHW